MTTQDIFICEELSQKLPHLRLGVLMGTVDVEPSSEVLKHIISERMECVSNAYAVETLSNLESIKWGRAAYRTLGKDPTRYRLSTEKLLRRIVKKEGLEWINNVVDVSNWLSVETQACIGTFDYDLLRLPLEIDYGRPDEHYRCLANYDLNVQGLPIMRSCGEPVGSTTSDSVRTAVSESTKQFLMVIYVFNPDESLGEMMVMAESILRTHCSANVKLHFTLGV